MGTFRAHCLFRATVCALVGGVTLLADSVDLNGTWTRAQGPEVTIAQTGNQLKLSYELPRHTIRTLTGLFDGKTASVKYTVKSVDDIGNDLPLQVRKELIDPHHYTFRATIRVVTADSLEFDEYTDDVTYSKNAQHVEAVTLSNTPEKSTLTRQMSRTLDSALLFDFDRYDLKPGANAELLKIQSRFIGKYPGRRFRIEGYTDDAGTDAYNMDLSQKRAQAVANWLTQHTVAANLLDVKGYGKTKPRYPNDTEANRARNRRVEIVLE